MKYVIVDKDTGKVLTPEVDFKLFPMAIEAPDDIVFGDMLDNGEWIRIGDRVDPNLTPKEPSIEERMKAVEEVLLGIL